MHTKVSYQHPVLRFLVMVGTCLLAILFLAMIVGGVVTVTILLGDFILKVIS